MTGCKLYLGQRARDAVAYLEWEAGRQRFLPHGEGFWRVLRADHIERFNPPLIWSDETVIRQAESEIITSGVFEEWLAYGRARAISGPVA